MTILEWLDSIEVEAKAAEDSRNPMSLEWMDREVGLPSGETMLQLVALLREACEVLAEVPCDCMWVDQPDGSQAHHPLCSLKRPREFLGRDVSAALAPHAPD